MTSNLFQMTTCTSNLLWNHFVQVGYLLVRPQTYKDIGNLGDAGPGTELEDFLG